MNDWLLSWFVNLLAQGISSATAKATVLTGIPTSLQSGASTILTAQTSDCTTMAGLAFTARTPATGWNYLTSSPGQTYVHI
jgi:hypothetical protein